MAHGLSHTLPVSILLVLIALQLTSDSILLCLTSAASLPNYASRTHSVVLRLHPNEDIMNTMVKFVTDNNINAASISTGVGSVQYCTLRLANNSYLTRFEGPFEIVSLVGTFSEGSLSHVHIALSDGITGRMVGGHLPQFPREGQTEISDPTCRIYTTLELILLIHEDLIFTRPIDPETTYDELLPIYKPTGELLDHRDEKKALEF